MMHWALKGGVFAVGLICGSLVMKGILARARRRRAGVMACKVLILELREAERVGAEAVRFRFTDSRELAVSRKVEGVERETHHPPAYIWPALIPEVQRVTRSAGSETSGTIALADLERRWRVALPLSGSEILITRDESSGTAST